MTITIVGGGNPSGPTFPVQRSVRLRSSATAYFNRTPASAGNRKTWTWSGWVKRGALGAQRNLFTGYVGSGTVDTSYFTITFNASDKLVLSGYSTIYRSSTPVYRDPSAWYHIVVAIDTTQATAANRFKVYINGLEITAFDTSNNPAQNTDLGINQASPHYIGWDAFTTYYDGYLAEVNFVDGQALTPTSFGAYNSYGVWSPAKYTGTYGTNGFYLNFQDNSAATATTIGKDSSGNGNNWTPNNISVTAGVTYDSMLDVPTLTSATNANFPVLNPLIKQDTGYTTTISGANLNASITYSSGANMVTIPATMSTGSSGKWYFEVTATSTQPSGGSTGIGVSTVESTTVSVNLPRNSYIYVGSDGSKTSYTGTAVNAAYGASYTTNDVIGVALDIDAGTLTFYKNNASQGTAFTGLAAGNYFPIVSSNGTGTRSYAINCGQRPFTYTPPSGFKSLNTYNLPAPTIPNGAVQFAATTYTGNGSTQSITNTVNGKSFQPDLVWVKARSVAYNNYLEDSVRGVGKDLSSNLTDAEATYNLLTAFNSNGFTVFTNGTYLASNQNGTTYVGWQWKASNAAAVTNTSGSISSQVSANPSAGFSIVTYTGTGANATVGHGLGVAPKMIIIKQRSAAGNNWVVYNSNLTSNAYYLTLNTTNAQSNAVNFWNNTSPTSSVFSIGSIADNNASSATYVAYCFSEIAGYSKFGSYTGNGSTDGPFVYTGMRPRWIMIKRTDTTGDWVIWDTSRNTYNAAQNGLYPNLAVAEGNSYFIDVLSNGFKLRMSTIMNVNAGTYIYAAFAENPFSYSLAR